MGRYPDDEVEVTRLGPSGALPTLPREPDALAVGDTSRDRDVDRARTGRPTDGEAAATTGVRLLDRDRELALLIGASNASP